MPANQDPHRSGGLALKARLSPAMSLFNRLDGFVLQLETSRDFFAHWPDQICHRIRSASGNSQQKSFAGEATAATQQRPAAATALNANHEEASMMQQSLQNASAICWTGQNYGR